MVARSTKLIHPSGVSIQTPILVSSFSSKGFRFSKKGSKIISEAFDLIKTTSDALTESALVSAYDLNYYYPPTKKFREIGFSPQLTFVDSGGYETLEDFDFSEAYKHPAKIKKWNLDMYENVLNSWPEYLPAVYVTYDHGSEKRVSLRNQIIRAEKILKKHPNWIFHST